MSRHEDLDALAKVFRDIRASTGETQEAFANRVAIDKGFVGAVERAERNVGYRKIRQVLIANGIDWVEFGQLLQAADPLMRLAAGDGSERRAL